MAWLEYTARLSTQEKGGFYHEESNPDFETCRKSSSQPYHMGGRENGKGEVIMAANVETMFSVREKPWHGIGTVVQDAPDSKEAIRLAGLDWKVTQKDVFKVS